MTPVVKHPGLEKTKSVLLAKESIVESQMKWTRVDAKQPTRYVGVRALVVSIPFLDVHAAVGGFPWASFESACLNY